MSLFGKTKLVGQQLKIVPRPAGDTTPLDPRVAEMLRQMGKDPDRFMFDPAGGDPTAALRDLPPAGVSLNHTFLFTDRSDALRCVDAFADRGRPVTITKDDQGWWVKLNTASDDTDHKAAHKRIVDEVAALGGSDHGFMPLNVLIQRK